MTARRVLSGSAELYSAVSQICNLRGGRKFPRLLTWLRSAECNPAIQQIENLRYGAGVFSRQALLHFQSPGARQRRAFTGLLVT